MDFSSIQPKFKIISVSFLHPLKKNQATSQKTQPKKTPKAKKKTTTKPQIPG